MKRVQVIIAVDSLIMGGIQKSLIAFIHSIHAFCDIDVLVWKKGLPETVALPEYVNRVRLPISGSVRTAWKKQGLFSADCLFSLLGCLRKKRWLVMPRIKKVYDVAIAYSHVGLLKYYVIDKITAKKKFAFYHHGAYEFSDSVRALDDEYYRKYDKLFAVSSYAKEVIETVFPELTNIEVLPNILDIEEMKRTAQEPCPFFSQDSGLKLLSVGRLSEEKNPLRIVEIARLLREAGIVFLWVIVGDGPLADSLKSAIKKNGLEWCVICAGNQMNPYAYMARCDAFIQVSLYEADPVTVKEAAVFNKPMLLSNITAFADYEKQLKNIRLCSTNEDFVSIIRRLNERQTEESGIETLNDQNKSRIYQAIFSDRKNIDLSNDKGENQ